MKPTSEFWCFSNISPHVTSFIYSPEELSISATLWSLSESCEKITLEKKSALRESVRLQSQSKSDKGSDQGRCWGEFSVSYLSLSSALREWKSPPTQSAFQREWINSSGKHWPACCRDANMTNERARLSKASSKSCQRIHVCSLSLKRSQKSREALKWRQRAARLSWSGQSYCLPSTSRLRLLRGHMTCITTSQTFALLRHLVPRRLWGDWRFYKRFLKLHRGRGKAGGGFLSWLIVQLKMSTCQHPPLPCLLKIQLLPDVLFCFTAS